MPIIKEGMVEGDLAVTLGIVTKYCHKTSTIVSAVMIETLTKLNLCMWIDYKVNTSEHYKKYSTCRLSVIL